MNASNTEEILGILWLILASQLDGPLKWPCITLGVISLIFSIIFAIVGRC